jgi:hypothetical protein
VHRRGFVMGQTRDDSQYFADLADAIIREDSIQAEINAGLIIDHLNGLITSTHPPKLPGDTTGVDVTAAKQVAYLVASSINAYASDKERARRLVEEARSEWSRMFAPTVSTDDVRHLGGLSDPSM